MLRFLKRVWRGWKSFAHGLIKGQSWLLMAFAYILALAPVALLFKVARPDPLDEVDVPLVFEREGPIGLSGRRGQRHEVRKVSVPSRTSGMLSSQCGILPGGETCGG